MKVFNCILGIFCIFASVYCIWYPEVTFLKVGWIVTLLLNHDTLMAKNSLYAKLYNSQFSEE